MTQSWLHWLIAFAITESVEVPIYRRGLKVSVPIALGASAITHPLVWFAMPLLTPRLVNSLWRGGLAWSVAYTIGCNVPAETFAILVEAAYFRALGKSSAFKWSLIANLASVAVGTVIQLTTGWP
jgi:hypothetical protein